MIVCAAPDCDEEFEPSTHNHRYHSSQCKRDVENRTRRRALISDVLAAVAPTYMGLDDDGTKAQLEFLRKECQRLNNLYEKHKNSKVELIEAVYQAVADNVAAIQVDPTPSPILPKATPEAEVACIGISDWQLAKVTPTYNTEICEARIEAYADKIIKLTEIQRSDHPVNEAHLWVVGDIVEGEMIFPSQSYLIDRSLYAQVAKDGPRIMGNFIRRLLDVFDHIKFCGVIGNHGAVGGRARKEYNNETNMDRMLYKIMEHIFAHEPRVEFNIPDGFGERSFYTVDNIGNLATLLVHGDQFPSPSSLYSYQKKILAWRNSGIQEPFDQVFMGHYHHNLKMSFGDVVARMGGSPESSNTFAQEYIGFVNTPSQHLQFVHPRRGIVTAEYDVYLV